MQTKTQSGVLLRSRIFNSKILLEFLDAFLIMGGVLIVGMIALYYNVFWIEIQSIMGANEQGVVIEEKMPQSMDERSMDQVTMSSDEIDNALMNAVSSKISKDNNYQLYTYSLDDYLSDSMSTYSLSFSTIPPGRFISIPSLGIQAPIIDVPYASEDKIMNGDFKSELKRGIVQYPHTSDPGKPGNTLLFGHSSVDTFQAKEEDFGFIFYKLPKMNVGDLIQVVRDGEIIEYEVSEKRIKRPKDVPDYLNEKTNHDMLTLMACYPLMSDAQRILIQAIPRSKIKKGVEPQDGLLAYNG